MNTRHPYLYFETLIALKRNGLTLFCPSSCYYEHFISSRHAIFSRLLQHQHMQSEPVIIGNIYIRMSFSTSEHCSFDLVISFPIHNYYTTGEELHNHCCAHVFKFIGVINFFKWCSFYNIHLCPFEGCNGMTCVALLYLVCALLLLIKGAITLENNIVKVNANLFSQ